MIRTVISLDPEDKQWLDRKAKENHVTMTELVRVAVRQYRRREERDTPPFDELLSKTSGMWKREDGLVYQQRVRDDWQAE